MNLGELYTYIKFIVNQDQLGDMPAPGDLNTILKNGNIKLFTNEWNPLLKIHNEKGYPLSDLIENTSSLRRFVVSADGVLTNGEYTIPADYQHYLAVRVQTSGVFRDCEIVADKKFNKFREDVFRVPPTEKPYGNISAGKLKALPWGSPVEFKYLRLPADPIFDCAYTEAFELVYMPPASRLVAAGALNNLVAQDGTILAYGVNHYLSTTTYPYTSKSVELDWDITEHDKVAEILISMIGYRNRELQMVQLKLAEGQQGK